MFPRKLPAVFIFIGVLILLCGGLFAQGGPMLNVAETTLNFGAVASGVSSQMYVHVNALNPYAVPSPGISMISVSGAGFSYDYISVPYTFYSLTPLTINVNFNPTTGSYYTGTLQITDFNGINYVVYLSGSNLPPAPEPQLDIRPYPFIHQIQEGSSGFKTATFVNVGAANLIFTVPETGLPDWLSFSGGLIGGKGDRVGPTTLVPGDSTQVNIWFYPGDLLPGYYNHIINVATNHSTAPTTPWEIRMQVTPAPVAADFSAMPTIGSLSSEIQFTNHCRVDTTLAGIMIASYQWDFDGNGTVDSYEQNPLHTYSATGTFSPALRIYANTGFSSYKQKTNYITISNNPPVLYNPIDTLTINEDGSWGPNSFTNYFSDPDGDVLTFGVVSSPQITVFSDGYRFRIEPKANWSGVQTVSISATDGHSSPVVHNIVVTVNPVNDPPVLTIPPNMYFIRNAPFVVDFGQYISDPDTPLSAISIYISRVTAEYGVDFNYSPYTPGQLSCTFTNVTGMWNIQNSFNIMVMDTPTGGPSRIFTMHVLEHFSAQFSGDLNVFLTGQSINFNDTTLGNPNWWEWDFDNDGNVDSTVQNPSYAYQFAGTYSVRLTLGHNVAGEQATYLWQNMFTLQGTAVPNNATLPPVLPIGGSPYNLMGGIIIPPGGTTINPDVQLNFLGGDPVPLNGPLFANGVDFQAPPGGSWGGFIFNSGSQNGSFSNCRILGANLPLLLNGFVPNILDSLVIVPAADTTIFYDGPGVVLDGNNPHLQNIRLYNYRGGIRLLNGTRTVTTPTLTNVRIRNSSETQRESADNTGIFLEGEIDATLDDIEIENCGAGIKFVNNNRVETTPTLTNIRIRNSSEASRGIYKGIVVEGAVAPSMSLIDINWAQTGIDLQPNVTEIRTTPTLTNIRVRNSTEGSRALSTGIRISNLSSISLNDIETREMTTGIDIIQDNRTTSTPTLTNVRIRNSSETSRVTDYGIRLSGDVIANLNDIITENCSYGIVYDRMGMAIRTSSTPTLTNVRIRNSSETQRGEIFGFVLTDLARVKLENDSLGNCSKAIQILNSQRTESTPTLTNIRVRNSSETQRPDNIGILLGSGVHGKISGCDIAGALEGIRIEYGATAEFGANRIKNCAAGIKAWATDGFAINRQTIYLEPDFMVQYPNWNYRAFDLNFSGPFLIHNNTIYNYPTLVLSNGADVQFNSNIGWAPIPLMQPFLCNPGSVVASYNDVNISPPLSGIGNISFFPAFIDIADYNFNLSYASPCIDTGDPGLPFDADGTVTDMGASPYLHKASFVSDVRFIQTGTTVHFTNTSIGHDLQQGTSIIWDLNNDGPDATTRDWEHTFTQPGLYDLKLIMQTGPLHDEMYVTRAIVVQNMLLQAPVISTLTVLGQNIDISWQPVTENIDHQPVAVSYYLVYSCDTPDGFYHFRGFTETPVTHYLHEGGANGSKQFYIVLGYYGTRMELESFIRSNPVLGADGSRIRTKEAKK